MTNLGGIRGVTFDAGGTLIAPHPSVGAVYAAAAARAGWPGLAAGLLERRFRWSWAAARPFAHTRAAWGALVDEVFAGLLPTPPTANGLFDALYDEFARPAAWRPCPGARETLEALASAGHALGLVSNWDERLRPLLGALGLAGYFDVIVVSCETGFTKPSPVMFGLAARALGLPPDRLLHVGDSAEEDVAGARSAGFAAWRAGPPPEGDGPLTELPARLRRRGPD